MRYPSLILLFLCTLGPTSLSGQNSIFGVHGIGFPGRPVNAGARSLGGGTALFDARSALNPASAAGLGPLIVTASFGTTVREFTALDTIASELSETRFPFALAGTRLRGLPLSIAISFSTFAERSYDMRTSGIVTIPLRGDSVEFSDRISSTGSVSDIRGAVGWRVMSGLNLGGAVHILSGSARLRSTRLFSNTRYTPVEQDTRVGLSGFGLSAGAVFSPLQFLSIGLSIRSDTELESTVDSATVGSVDLPLSYSAGILFHPVPLITLATTVERHLWASSAADIEADGHTRAFNDWSVGSGLELGAGSRTPLRMGVRYAKLPFSPSAEQASELTLSGGTALGFAGGRASIEANVERILRDGAGAEERAWFLMFAITVIP